jgi:hypothetical protein
MSSMCLVAAGYAGYGGAGVFEKGRPQVYNYDVGIYSNRKPSPNLP